MKRKIGIVAFVAFILLDIVLIYYFAQSYQEKKTVTEKIEVLPSFSLEDVYGAVFTEKSIPSENWIVVVFFNSECDYCQSEAEQLSELKSGIEDIRFLWISSEPIETIRHFQKANNLEEITFLHDEQNKIAQEWGISTTPQFLIYTPQKRLFKNHKGALRIDHLIKQLEDAAQTN